MRPILVLLHRWFGLATAVFLFVAGLTGAVISWDHELDEWLNPQLYRAASGANSGAAQPPLRLAADLEAADPRVRVTYLPLSVEPGRTLQMSVSPRVDPATGELFDVDYNEVAVNPASAAVQGRRFWGAISLAPENLLPFLYKLHYSMHIPEASGIEFGILFMGIIGLVWVLDCLIALYLSFPNRASWRKSFLIRWRQPTYKLNFDLHRTGGVWVWLILLTTAVTSVSMNLNLEVVRPVVSWFSTISTTPFDERAPVLLEKAAEPRVQRAQVIELAVAESARRGFDSPAGAVFYSPEFDTYGIGFFETGNDHGDGGLGNPWLYFDAQDGRLLGAELPGTGTAGDIFLQAQFPLHSGRIFGVAGRVLMSAMGLIVAMLSVTGVVIWARKRRARQSAAVETQAFGIALRAD